LAGKFHEWIGRISKMSTTTRHSCMGNVTIGPMWTNKIVNGRPIRNWALQKCQSNRSSTTWRP
jgi:hypothetical protein